MSERRHPSANDIDALLADFFRAEQPNPWPRLVAPDSEAKEITPAAPRTRRASNTVQGRYALAASIAILAVTCMWMAGRAPTPMTGPNPGLDGSNAERKIFPPKPIKKVDLRELNRADQ